MSVPVFIVDTNVLIAGLITANAKSPTVRILDAMLEGRVIYLLSPELLHEYRGVLLRPRLTKLHGLTEEEIDHLLTEITANAIWHETPARADHPPPDPQDAHLWALLASEPGAALITGDQLLLDNPKSQSSIISPATTDRLFLAPIDPLHPTKR